MLFITGLLTLLAIAQAGGDHTKGGSITQQKVAQEDIIPSPFNVKSATAPFGTKVFQPEASDPFSKTARRSASHHVVKTTAGTQSKTQIIPSLHHAASSPLIQDQVSIDDPASSSRKGIKTLKTAPTGKTRFSHQDMPMGDPIALPVIQRVETIQDPVSGTRQIKTVKTVDPGMTRFSQEDKQVRDPVTQIVKSTGDSKIREPITQPIIQTVKTSEDPSASVVTKTVKTTVKTAEPSNLRTKAALKTSQEIVDMQRISNMPLSIVQAARRNTLKTSSAKDGTLLSPKRYYQPQEINRGLLLSTLAESEKQLESGIANELGEIILDEETLHTLQNAGGIINDNGRITLNEEGIKVLQNIRGDSLSTYSSGIPGTGIRNLQSESPTRISSTTSTTPLVIVRSSSALAGSADLSTGIIRPTLSNMGRMETPGSVAPKPRIRTPYRDHTGAFRSSTVLDKSRNTVESSRTSSTSTLRAGSSGAYIPTPQRTSQATGVTRTTGSLTSGTALFNGKEISIEGLKEGQIFDENLRPIIPGASISSPGEIRSNFLGNVASRSDARSPSRSLSAGLRTATTTSTSRSSISSGTSNTLSQSTPTVRARPVSTVISSGQRRTQIVEGIRSDSYLTPGTVLFNGKEISVDGLKEGQIFDENLRPIATGSSISSSGRTSSTPLRSLVSKPSARFPQRSQSVGLRSSTVTSTSRGTISRSRIPSTLSQSAPNIRTGPIRTTISSGQRLTQTMGGVRSHNSLTSGTVLFNGKEISVDGLKEGQIFDENLKPIKTGASTSSSGQLGGIPLRRVVSKPSVRSQSVGLRSSSVTSTSRGNINRSRAPSTSSQYAPSIRARPVSTITLSGQRLTQTMGGVRSSNSLTSGTVLFNGKEISVDGLKEGQVFDENLRPITTGTSTSSSGQLGGIPLRSEVLKPSARSPQRFQSARLKYPIITTTSGGSISSARTSSTLLPKSAPSVRAGPQSPTIPSEQQISQKMGGIGTGGSLTSGTVLFNGKEISVDGLREGQMFDENLQPILSRNSGIAVEKSAEISSGEINTIAFENLAQRPRTMLTPTEGLRFSSIPSTSRVENKASSSLPAQPASVTGIRSFGNVVSFDKGIPQEYRTMKSGGSLTSGTVLFNGKVINIGGLKEGQMFDENLQPILAGSVEKIAEKPSAILSSGQISEIPPRSVAALNPRPKAPQRLQTSVLRSSAITSSTSNSRRTGTRLSQDVPAIRGGPLGNTILSETGGIQTMGGIRPKDSLTYGSVLFNGKEISISGLREGQIFDENLQPILSGPSGITAQKPATISSSAQRSTISSRNAILKPGLRSPQTLQAGNLRSSAITSSSGGTISNARRTSTLISQPAPVTGQLSSSILYGQENTQMLGGVTSSSSLTSGTALFKGKEISVSGLQEGQLFDENLKPIISEFTGLTSEKSANLPYSSASADISGSAPRRPLLNLQRSQTGNIPKPGGRSPQRSQASGLTSSVNHSSAGGTFTSSRISGFQPIAAVRSGILTNTISSTTRRSQAALGGARSQSSVASGTALFNGKEVSIDGLKEGQMFDENLRPILSGAAGTLPRRMSTTFQRSGQISSAVPSRSAPNVQDQSFPTRISPVRSSQASVGIRSGGSLTSGTALFGGKEISVDGLNEGQLFDENLRPIISGTSGTLLENSAALSTYGQISSVPLVNAAPKPRSILSHQSQSTITRSAGISSSRTASTSAAQSISNVRDGSSSSGVSSGQRLPQTFGGTRSSGSLTTGTVLFNGKEISIDGLKEGQMFDENLRPIGEYSETIRSSDGISGVQRSSTRNVGARTLSATSGLRSQAASTRGSPTTSGSLNYIDVTRTDESLSPENILTSGRVRPTQINAARRISLGGASTYANPRAVSSGSKVTQDRITPEISQFGIETPVEDSILNIPDIQPVSDIFNKASSLEAPSVSRQTQLKVEDVFEQGSLSNPDTLRSVQVQESVPFSVSSKNSLTKIAQISPKDIDIPIAQEKLLGDFSSYLPKTSFLPPFNYALPQLSTSKYSVKSPAAIAQQKVEQVFV